MGEIRRVKVRREWNLAYRDKPTVPILAFTLFRTRAEAVTAADPAHHVVITRLVSDWETSTGEEVNPQ